jgi:hypothetical protein
VRLAQAQLGNYIVSGAEVFKGVESDQHPSSSGAMTIFLSPTLSLPFVKEIVGIGHNERQHHCPGREPDFCRNPKQEKAKVNAMQILF